MTEQGERYRITTAAEAIAAVDESLSEARRSIDILSPGLDPALYDRLEVVDAVRQLIAGAGRRASVRVLVRDGSEIARRGHRLAGLAQQLTSALEVRRLAEDDAKDDTACVIVDRRRVIRWQPGSGYAGQVDPHAPGVARRTEAEFTERWERAEPEPEFRRLAL